MDKMRSRSSNVIPNDYHGIRVKGRAAEERVKMSPSTPVHHAPSRVAENLWGLQNRPHQLPEGRSEYEPFNTLKIAVHVAKHATVNAQTRGEEAPAGLTPISVGKLNDCVMQEEDVLNKKFAWVRESGLSGKDLESMLNTLGKASLEAAMAECFRTVKDPVWSAFVAEFLFKDISSLNITLTASSHSSTHHTNHGGSARLDEYRSIEQPWRQSCQSFMEKMERAKYISALEYMKAQMSAAQEQAALLEAQRVASIEQETERARIFEANIADLTQRLEKHRVGEEFQTDQCLRLCTTNETLMQQVFQYEERVKQLTRSLQQLYDEHEQVLGKTRTEHSDEISLIQSSLQEVQLRAEEYEECVKQLTLAMHERADDAEQKLTTMRTEHAEEISRLMSMLSQAEGTELRRAEEHEERVKQLTLSLQQRRLEEEETLKTIRTEHTEELARVKGVVSQVEASLQAEQLRAEEHEDRVKDLTLKLQQCEESAEQTLRTMRSEHAEQNSRMKGVISQGESSLKAEKRRAEEYEERVKQLTLTMRQRENNAEQKLNTMRTEHAEEVARMKGEADASEQRRLKKCEENVGELLRMGEQFSSIRTEHAEEITHMKGMVTKGEDCLKEEKRRAGEYEERVKQLTLAMQQHEGLAEEALNTMRTEHEEEISHMKGMVTKGEDSLKEEKRRAEEYEDRVKQLTLAMEQREDREDQTLRTIRAEHAEEVSRMKGQAEGALKAEQLRAAEYEERVKRITVTMHERASEAEQKLTTMRTEHAEEISRLMSMLSQADGTELRRADEHEERVKQLTLSLQQRRLEEEETLKTIRTEHTEELARVKGVVSQVEASLQAEQLRAEEHEDRVKDLTLKLQQCEESAEQTLRTVRSEHAEQNSRMKGVISQGESSLKAEKRRAEEYEERVKQLTLTMRQREEEQVQTLRTTRTEHAEEISRMKGSNSDVEALLHAQQLRAEEYEDRVQQLMLTMQQREDHKEATLSTIRSDHAEEISRMKRQAEGELESQQLRAEEYEDRVQRLMVAIQQRDDREEERLNTMRTEHAEEVARMKGEADASEQRRMREYEERVEELQRMGEQLNTMRTEHEEEISHMKGMVTKGVDSLKAEKRRAGEYEDRVQQLTLAMEQRDDREEQTLRTIRAEHAEEISRMKGQAEGALKSEQLRAAEYEERVKELTLTIQNHEESVEKTLKTMRIEHSEEISHLKRHVAQAEGSLQAETLRAGEYEERVKKLTLTLQERENHFEQRLTTVSTEHAEEISRLMSMLSQAEGTELSRAEEHEERVQQLTLSLQQRRLEEEETLKTIRTEHTEELARVKGVVSQVEASLQAEQLRAEEHEDRVKDLTLKLQQCEESAEQTLRTMRSEHAEQNSRMKGVISQGESSLKAEKRRAEEYEERVKQLTLTMRQREEEQVQTLRTTRTEHAEEISRMKGSNSDVEALLHAQQLRAEEYEDRVQQLMLTMQQREDRKEATLSTMRNDHAEEISRIKRQAEGALKAEQLRAEEYEEGVKELTLTMRQREKHAEQKLNTMRTEHAEEVARMKGEADASEQRRMGEYEERVEELQRMGEQLNTMRTEHAQDISSMKGVISQGENCSKAEKRRAGEYEDRVQQLTLAMEQRDDREEQTLRTIRAEHAEEISRMKGQAEGALKSEQLRAAEYEERVKELTLTIQKREESVEQTLKSMRIEHSEEISHLKRHVAQAEGSLQAETLRAGEYEERVKKLTLTLQERENHFEQRLTTASTEHAEEISRLMSMLSQAEGTELSRAEEHEERVKQLTLSLQQRRLEEEETLKTIRTEHTEELARVKGLVSQVEASLQAEQLRAEEHEDRVKDLTLKLQQCEESAEQTLRKVRSEHAQEISSMKGVISQDESSLQAEKRRAEEYEERVKQLTLTMRQREEEQVQTLRTTRTEHAEEISRMKGSNSDVEALLHAQQLRAEEYEDHMQQLMLTMQQREDRKVATLSTMRSDHAEEISRIRRQAEGALKAEQLRAEEYEEGVKELTLTMRQREKHAEQKLTTMRTEHAEEVARMKGEADASEQRRMGEYEERVEELQRMGEQLNTMRTEHEEEISRMKGVISQGEISLKEEKRRAEEYEERVKQLTLAMEQREDREEQTLRTIRAEHAEEISRMKGQAEGALKAEQLRAAEYEERVKELTLTIQKREESMEQTLKTLKTMRIEHSEEISHLKRHVAQAEGSLQAETLRAGEYEERVKILTHTLQERENHFEQRLTTASTEHAEEISRLMSMLSQAEGTELSRAEEHEERVKQLTLSLQQRRLEEEETLKTIRTEHTEELARVKGVVSQVEASLQAEQLRAEEHEDRVKDLTLKLQQCEESAEQTLRTVRSEHAEQNSRMKGVISQGESSLKAEKRRAEEYEERVKQLTLTMRQREEEQVQTLRTTRTEHAEEISRMKGSNSDVEALLHAQQLRAEEYEDRVQQLMLTMQQREDHKEATLSNMRNDHAEEISRMKRQAEGALKAEQLRAEEYEDRVQQLTVTMRQRENHAEQKINTMRTECSEELTRMKGLVDNERCRAGEYEERVEQLTLAMQQREGLSEEALNTMRTENAEEISHMKGMVTKGEDSLKEEKRRAGEYEDHVKQLTLAMEQREDREEQTLRTIRAEHAEEISRMKGQAEGALKSEQLRAAEYEERVKELTHTLHAQSEDAKQKFNTMCTEHRDEISRVKESFTQTANLRAGEYEERVKKLTLTLQERENHFEQRLTTVSTEHAEEISRLMSMLSQAEGTEMSRAEEHEERVKQLTLSLQQRRLEEEETLKTIRTEHTEELARVKGVVSQVEASLQAEQLRAEEHEDRVKDLTLKLQQCEESAEQTLRTMRSEHAEQNSRMKGVISQGESSLQAEKRRAEEYEERVKQLTLTMQQREYDAAQKLNTLRSEHAEEKARRSEEAEEALKAEQLRATEYEERARELALAMKQCEGVEEQALRTLQMEHAEEMARMLEQSEGSLKAERKRAEEYEERVKQLKLTLLQREDREKQTLATMRAQTEENERMKEALSQAECSLDVELRRAESRRPICEEATETLEDYEGYAAMERNLRDKQMSMDECKKENDTLIKRLRDVQDELNSVKACKDVRTKSSDKGKLEKIKIGYTCPPTVQVEKAEPADESSTILVSNSNLLKSAGLLCVPHMNEIPVTAPQDTLHRKVSMKKLTKPKKKAAGSSDQDVPSRATARRTSSLWF